MKEHTFQGRSSCHRTLIRTGVGALVREGALLRKGVQDADASNENTASLSLLDEIRRDGGRQMLATALQAEVSTSVAAFADEVAAHGWRLVVHNGSHAEREVGTEAGAVPVRQPWVNDKRIDFPGAHWIHRRTTRPIASTFATVRLRQRVAERLGTRATGLAMACKRSASAQHHWRAVHADHLVALVSAGATLEHGVLVARPDASTSGDTHAA